MDLISKLREQLKDVRYCYEGISVVCTDGDASAATLEINNKRLYTSITGGTAGNLTIPLDSTSYKTIFDLVYYINNQSGYRAELLIDAHADKKSTELEKIGNTDIDGTAAILHTRLFEDDELERYIRESVKTHDESFTMESLPSSEEKMVMCLVKCVVYRDLAGDVVKRKHLDMEVSDLLRMANDWERMYKALRDEQKLRVGGFQKHGDDGDIIVSTLTRPSLRTGESMPVAVNRLPEQPRLHTPRLGTGGVANLSWERVRDTDFAQMRLYRATDPNVKQDATCIYNTRDITKTAYRDTVTASGDYFYRLFVSDLNGEWSSSLVVMVRITV